MLGTGWTEVAALIAAFVIAAAAFPAGISGAVLLLPFQVSMLGTPSPAVTPTNLLYNWHLPYQQDGLRFKTAVNACLP